MGRWLESYFVTDRRNEGEGADVRSVAPMEAARAWRRAVGPSLEVPAGMWLDLRPVIGNVLNDILLASGAWSAAGRETFVEFSIAGADDAERCRESGWWLKCATLRLGLVRVAES